MPRPTAPETLHQLEGAPLPLRCRWLTQLVGDGVWSPGAIIGARRSLVAANAHGHAGAPTSAHVRSRGSAWRSEHAPTALWVDPAPAHVVGSVLLASASTWGARSSCARVAWTSSIDVTTLELRTSAFAARSIAADCVGMSTRIIGTCTAGGAAEASPRRGGGHVGQQKDGIGAAASACARSRASAASMAGAETEEGRAARRRERSPGRRVQLSSGAGACNRAGRGRRRWPTGGTAALALQPSVGRRGAKSPSPESRPSARKCHSCSSLNCASRAHAGSTST